MIYGFSLNKSFGSLMRWDPARGKAESQPNSWTSGMTTVFESCLSFSGDGFHAGETAVNHFLDNSGDPSALGNFIPGISAELLDKCPMYIPAKGRTVTGEEILGELFRVLGDDLRTRNPPSVGDRDFLAVSAPAVMGDRMAAVFAACAARSGIPTEVQPGWFFRLISCMTNDPAPVTSGRALYLEFGEEESVAAAVMYNGDMTVTPRSVAVLPEESLSHRMLAGMILSEVCGDNSSYRFSDVPAGYWKTHDGVILLRESERIRRIIMDKEQPSSYVVGKLYGGACLDHGEITPERFYGLAEGKGFSSKIKTVIDQAMGDAGWTADMLDRVYIGSASGKAFRRTALEHLGIPEGDMRCPAYRKKVNQTAEGAAIYGSLRTGGSSISLRPVRRMWLCCRMESEDPGRLWHYMGLYTQGSMRIPCRDSGFAELFLLDATIDDGGMSHNCGVTGIGRIGVPAGNGVTLTVIADGSGGFSCRFSDRNGVLGEQSFRTGNSTT